MAFLIDTNVVSETLKPRPAAAVVEWMGGQSVSDLFLSSVTLGELMRGARRLRDEVRGKRIERWVRRDLASQFRDRVLPFDAEAAVLWGEIMGDGDRSGKVKEMADAQIAAIARRHGLTLVTRNVDDFAGMSVAMLDPWRSGADA